MVVHYEGDTMSTSKPRITITLEDEAYALLQRMSAQRGKSMSAIVTELLDAAAPSLERASVLMQRAQLAQEDVEEQVEALLRPRVPEELREAWREEEEENRLAWRAARPNLILQARQPAATRPAAPAKKRKKPKKGARGKV